MFWQRSSSNEGSLASRSYVTTTSGSIQMVVAMIKMFKHNSLFYMKTLAIYGVVLAVLHCPSMRDEQNEANYQLYMTEEIGSSIGGTSLISIEKPVYPYAKMMNLIEQCRSIEAEFHRDTVGFNQHECEIETLEQLSAKASKVLDKLRYERGCFADYASSIRYQRSDEEKTNYRGSRKRRQSFFGAEQVHGKERRNKVTRYTSQVLNEYIYKMEDVSLRLNKLVLKAKKEDEEAKAKSESEAKEKMSQNLSL